MSEYKKENNKNKVLLRKVIKLLIWSGTFVVPIFLPEMFIYTLCLIGINSIAALGLNILVGYTDQVSLGHASFVGIGAYTATIFSNMGFPILLSLPIAVIICSFAGLVIGLPCLRLKGLYLAVATLAFAWAIPELILKSPSLTGGYAGISIKESFIFGFSIKKYPYFFYCFILVLVILVLWVVANIRYSKFGRAFIALRDSEEGSKAMGINISIYKTLAFVLSSALAGIAGSLYAYLIGTVTPYDFGFWISIYFLVAIVIGGLGSIFGSLLGGAFITLVPLWLSGLRNMPNIVFGIALVLVVMLFPEGLAGLMKNMLNKLEKIALHLRQYNE